tara:strand:+ start:1339 stop:1929 length:591 start_codon:yes stop_codon:yes gene_type:complete
MTSSKELYMIKNPILLSPRKTTESWLLEVIRKKNIKFKYFITLSFYKAQVSTINQYLDNKHIKKVILDFFYPNRKPKDRIRIWFFIERHKTDYLHLHILMEGVDSWKWITNNNRKITISKKTLFHIVGKDFKMDDVITEALTNHLQMYINKLGKGKQSVDIKKVGNIEKRVHYVNKSFSTLDFNHWEHIDFDCSDL